MKRLLFHVSCLKEKNAEKHHLYNLLHKLHAFESQDPGLDSDEINTVRAEIQKYETEACRGAVVRLRTTRFMDEEPTKRALGDEKQYALYKQIESGGSIYTEKSQIITIFQDHYKNVFTAVTLQKGYEEKADQFISLMPQLQEDDPVSVDDEITGEEI